MARPGITYDQVAAAAETLQARGERPTIDAIRQYLGTGSPNTVNRYLSQWKDKQPAVVAAPIEMPAAIHAAIVEEIRRASVESRAGVDKDLAEARQTIDALAENCDQLEGERDELVQEIAEQRADNQQLVGQMDELNRENERIRGELQREREAQDKVRQQLAEASVRLEALPRLEAELQQQRQELAQERQGHADARQAAAVAQTAQQSLQEQLAVATKRESTLLAQVAELQAGVERAARADGQQVAELQAAVERAARAEGQLAALQKPLDADGK